jgi:hypothetical protein
MVIQNMKVNDYIFFKKSEIYRVIVPTILPVITGSFAAPDMLAIAASTCTIDDYFGNVI